MAEITAVVVTMVMMAMVEVRVERMEVQRAAVAHMVEVLVAVAQQVGARAAVRAAVALMEVAQRAVMAMVKEGGELAAAAMVDAMEEETAPVASVTVVEEAMALAP